MSSEAVRRLAALRVIRFDASPVRAARLDVEAARERVIARWDADLCGLLNAMTRGELAEIASQLRLPATGRAPDLRARLWDHGSELERGGMDVSPAIQPRPILLGGHLVV